MDKLFGALADARRRKILRLVAERQMSVGEIGKALGVKQSTLSSGLAILRRAGLVSARVSGRQRLYRLNGKIVKKVVNNIKNLFGENYMGIISIRGRRYSY